MALSDEVLRAVPYVEIFPDAAVRDEILGGIAREIAERDQGDDDPGAFALLVATRKALARLRDVDDQSDGGQTHALLLFHTWHLREHEGEHLLASVPVCRWAVEGTTGTSGKGHDHAQGLPACAYVQLPRHLFWVRESEEDRPRSLDGFFWTRTGETLHLLGVVDPQSTEGGVEVLPLPAVPLADREVWLTESMREDDEDFRSTIPGAELEGMYELRTAGELLKLAARVDRYVARFPAAFEEGAVAVEEGAVEEGATDPPTAEGEVGEVPPYRRLVLAGED